MLALAADGDADSDADGPALLALADGDADADALADDPDPADAPAPGEGDVDHPPLPPPPPPLPPPLEPPVEPPRRRGDRHPKSHWWGAFNIIYRPPTIPKKGKPQNPRWEATCPSRFHNDEENHDKCRKTMSFPANPEEEVLCMWRIRHWCNLAIYAQQSKKKHLKKHPAADELCGEVAITEARLPDDWDGDGEEPPPASDGEALFVCLLCWLCLMFFLCFGLSGRFYFCLTTAYRR